MKVFLSIALTSWILFVLWFVKHQRAECACSSNFNEAVVENTSASLKASPIIFVNGSFKPELSDQFLSLRDSLVSHTGENDIIEIIGIYSAEEEEKDATIGLKRANAIRILFDGFVDLSKIKISSKRTADQNITPMLHITSSRSNPLVSQKENKASELNASTEKPDYVIYFKDDSSNIIGRSEVQQYIDALSARVKKSKEKILLEGFDDNGRSAIESIDLAKRRTWRVRKCFNDNFVRRKLLIIRNTGQANSKNPNNTPEGRSKNRRVEITIQKK